MIIDADLTADPPRVELLEPGDCTRFHVAARGGDATALGAALSGAAVGRLLPSGEAMIDVAALQRMAEGRVGDGWADEFAGMVKYAGSKGWLDGSGTSIQAHVEWAG